MNQASFDWKDKVAVITGAGSGIGKSIAEKCISLGMKVVLADINLENLSEVKRNLAIDETMIYTIQTDVTKYTSVEKLAKESFEKFKRVDVLFNNAGVADNGFIWESSLKDWDWVLGVNLMGVVHGIKAFIPKMIEQNSHGYIVNTSSLSGLMSANLGIYSVSKHAVVSLSETLYQSLALIDSKLKVVVFCPGFIKTQINSSERNRPEDLTDDNPENTSEKHPELIKIKKFVDRVVANGMDPKIAIDILFQQLKEGKFYIQTHTDEKTKQSIRKRMENILNGVFEI
jgi:NADP-dependent 3-hydroxy acid dehydrogenase YdfG